jgi:hypothetical protein
VPKPSAPEAVKLFSCYRCGKVRKQTLAFELRDMEGHLAIEYWKCATCRKLNEIRYS